MFNYFYVVGIATAIVYLFRLWRRHKREALLFYNITDQLLGLSLLMNSFGYLLKPCYALATPFAQRIMFLAVIFLPMISCLWGVIHELIFER